MYNHVMLIGRTLEEIDTENNLRLAVAKPFKTQLDSNEQDVFNMKLPDGMSCIKSTLKKGSRIAVKGKLMSINNTISICIEKIVYLAPNDIVENNI